MRKPIDVNGSLMDLVVLMAEGNVGAATVLVRLLQTLDDKDPFKDGMLTVLGLAAMNIRGSQIWVAYKDHCGEDLAKLQALVLAGDQGLIDTVNAATLKGACGADTPLAHAP